MGGSEAGALALAEPLVKYHPWVSRFLTRTVKPVCGPCQVGGLTGAVASQSVTEAREGHLTLGGNQGVSVKAEGGLTARHTCRAGTKVGLSDLAVASGSAVT